MAEIMSFAVQTLDNLLLEEFPSLYGVRGEVEEIRMMLNFMIVFLKDLNVVQYIEGYESLIVLLALVRKEAYDVSDALERIIIRVESSRRGCIKNTLNRYKTRKEIREIKSRISKIVNRIRTYWGGIDDSLHERVALERQLQIIEDDFIGIEVDVKKLVERLVDDGGESSSVVSICGMAGLGKTVIAKEVYNHAKVKTYFDELAWVRVSPEWQTTRILNQILHNFIHEEVDEIANLEDSSQLITKIFEIQQQKRCLVVLDDIWSTDAWDAIKGAFPKENTTSKLLLTSRDKRVPIHVNPEGFLHEPRFLNEEESWMLLKKKAFSERHHDLDSKDVERMEELGVSMVSHCGGLPFAIVELGRVLSSNYRVSEWEIVRDDIKSLLRWADRRLTMALELSYLNLPNYLKPCFLYLGKFKEDSEIDAERLYQLWIAEYMVLPKNQIEGGKTMMDVAESYLEELADRCMVKVQLEREEYGFKKFKSCRVHTMMRDWCLSKAKDTNFFNIIDFQDHNSYDHLSSSSSKTMYGRRVVIYSGAEGTSDRDLSSVSKLGVRSLLFFNEYDRDDGILPSMVKSQLNEFIWLKVLILEGLGKLDRTMLRSIDNLIRLRYLSLKRTCSEMPLPNIKNLNRLQTLDLRDGPYPKGNMLVKMWNLQHVYFPIVNKEKSSSPKLRLDGMIKLEILENFDPSWCQTEDLIKLSNLRKLKAKVALQDLKAVKEIIPYLKSDEVENMKHLSFWLYDRDFRHEEWQTKILKELVDCIPELTLECRLGKKLQVLSNNPTFPSRLTKLTLINSKLVEDPMPVLGALPNLRFLRLLNAFKGRKMVCARNGFLQLETLELLSLRNLHNLTVLDGAMPILSRIGFYECDELRTIPDGLRFVRSLKELEIFEMPKEFTDSVRAVQNGEGGIDIERIRHVASLIIDKQE